MPGVVDVFTYEVVLGADGDASKIGLGTVESGQSLRVYRHTDVLLDCDSSRVGLNVRRWRGGGVGKRLYSQSLQVGYSVF